MEKVIKKFEKEEAIQLLQKYNVFGNRCLIAKYEDGDFESFYFRAGDFEKLNLKVELVHQSAGGGFAEKIKLSCGFDNIKFARGMVIQSMIESLYEAAHEEVYVATLQKVNAGRIDEKSWAGPSQQRGY